MNKKSVGNRVAQMRTEVISNMVTNHARRIGSLHPSEEFRVEFIDVVGDVTTLEGEIFQEEMN